jgi:hypothetical protein
MLERVTREDFAKTSQAVNELPSNLKLIESIVWLASDS